MICPACNNDIGAYSYCGYCGLRLTKIDLHQITIACLRADVSGFTRLTTGINAEEAFSFLKLILTNAAQEIEKAGGTIYRFIGDEVVGVFGLKPFDYHSLFKCAVQLTSLEAFERKFGMKVGMEEDDVLYARGPFDGIERDLFFGDIFKKVAVIQKSIDTPGLVIGNKLYKIFQREEVSGIDKHHKFGGKYD